MNLSQSSPIAESSGRLSPWFLVVIALIAFATLFTAIVQLPERFPLSPWESSIAIESLRLDAGLPVYEPAHATHMYGPLLTLLDAGVFRAFGPNFAAARIVMSIFAFGLVIFLAGAACRGTPVDHWILGLALFAGTNLRTNFVFFSMQPDCLAALLGVAGLYFWSTRVNARWRSAAALTLFVAATFTKQTAAAFALVPIAHAILCDRPFRLRGMLIAGLPAFAILAVLGLVRIVRPEMFHAIVIVPASIKMHPKLALLYAGYLLLTFPLFAVAVFALFRRRTQLTPTERWLIAAALVLLPVTVWTMCKSGSDYNSLLYAFLAMTALFVAELKPILEWLRSFSGLRRAVLSALLALIMLVSIFAAADSVWILFARHGDERYDDAVEVAERLGNGLISPQDPTIAWRATGYFGRSFFCESDAHAVNGEWPNELPRDLAGEIAGAKSIITVGSFIPTAALGRELRAQSFRRVAVPVLEQSSYVLWVRGR